jgi:hypothetical protein
MKKYLLSFFLVLLLFCANAQRKGDIGVFSGYSYYLGEMNHLTPFKLPVYTYGLIYRHSFDLRYSLRGSIFKSKLWGSDFYSPYAYNKLRDRSFNTSITDFTLQLEFNFLPYITTSPAYNFSTYVTAGVTYFLTGSKIDNHFALPFGVGCKVNVTKRLSAGAELVIRKTYTDLIDGLGAPANDPLTDPYISTYNRDQYRQNSLPKRNDLYAFGGIFVTYKIFYSRTRCPAYDDNSFKE